MQSVALWSLSSLLHYCLSTSSKILSRSLSAGTRLQCLHLSVVLFRCLTAELEQTALLTADCEWKHPASSRSWMTGVILTLTTVSRKANNLCIQMEVGWNLKKLTFWKVYHKCSTSFPDLWNHMSLRRLKRKIRNKFCWIKNGKKWIFGWFRDAYMTTIFGCKSPCFVYLLYILLMKHLTPFFFPF